MKPLAVLIALALVGCASAPQERIVYKTVEHPIPVPCMTAKLPDPEPRETDALDLETATLGEMIRAILIDRERAKVEALNLRSLIKACGG